MKTIVTQSIVLARTNFQEADRIITVLTPDQGKLRLMAKGVRKPKSKLAGGIELFTVDDITYLPGRGELGTLISSRLSVTNANIVKDINRTMYGYEVLKLINKITEEPAEAAYFELLQKTLAGLDNLDLPLELVQTWFSLQLLELTGHSPNLQTDATGSKLSETEKYVFSFDDMAFAPTPAGQADAKLIKFLRLCLAAESPALPAKVTDAAELSIQAAQLTNTMSQLYLQP